MDHNARMANAYFGNAESFTYWGTTIINQNNIRGKLRAN
jgi:hypothetical protein